MTLSEAALDQVLKEVMPRHNLEYFAQHISGKFIVDFAIPKKRVAIEVDGIYHFFQGRQDGYRSKILKKRGWKVLRFTNFEVDTNMPHVITEICKACGVDAQNTFQM